MSGKIESPLGTRTFKSQPLQEFDVPDMSNIDTSRFEAVTPELEQELRRAKADKINNRQRLSDGAKKRIDMLIGMSRLTRTFDLNDISFTLQTLKSKEMREAISNASKFDGTVQFPFEIRKQLLARSIIEIGGATIDQFLSSSDIEAKFAFIDELEESLLNRIYKEYTILSNEANSKFAIKDEASAAEVIDDLKK